MNSHDNNILRGARARVLIVEDNRAIAQALKLVLQHEGYETRWCDDESLYRIVKEWHPAVILMDLKLPNLDGRAATRALKEDPGTRHIPIIVVTAENIGAGHAGEFNANDLITKPFPVRRLLERVASWVNAPFSAAASSVVTTAQRAAARSASENAHGGDGAAVRGAIAAQEGAWKNGASAAGA